MRFAIFTHAQHRVREKRFFAYAPYVREMNLWLKHVKHAEVVAPLTTGQQGEQGMAYHHSELVFNEVPSFHLLTILNTLKAVIKMPYIFYRILKVMKRADHLHLRCPGNVGLLACICQFFFPSKLKTAKYAGNWDPKADQPWTYRLQRWILSNSILTRNMQVLVYGEWPGQTKNIKSFFTASFSEKEVPSVREKSFDGRLTFLFVGNLVPGKHPLKAIELVKELQRKLGGSAEAPEIRLDIYGEGPEREMLEMYSEQEDLTGLVNFKGNRRLEGLKEAYQQAHFVVLPSQSEGWPKAIAEGMFFGCVPIATPVSCVPWMLGGGTRGILISENDFSGSRVDSEQRKDDNLCVVEETVDRIIDLIQNPEKIKQMSNEAKAWSQQYTLERFEAAIKNVLA